MTKPWDEHESIPEGPAVHPVHALAPLHREALLHRLVQAEDLDNSGGRFIEAKRDAGNL